MDAGLRGCLSGGVVEPFGGRKLADGLPRTRHGENAHLLAIVGALRGGDAAEAS